MPEKLLIFDRDGTVLVRPRAGTGPLAGNRLVRDVIPALLRLQQAGFRLLMLDVPADPDATALVQEMLGSQGISIAQTLSCPHAEEDRCDCLSAPPELLREVLADPAWDRAASALVSGCPGSLPLAPYLGVPSYRIESGAAQRSWEHVAHVLIERPRTALVERTTRETSIRVGVDLDASREPQIKTGLGFFDHMLEQLGKHGGFALEVACAGDLNVDEHHTVEDVALTLGEALRRALGDKRGIERYGFLLPMDETAAEIAIDLGGRPYLVFEGTFTRERVGDLPTELVPHFFQSLSQTLGAAIHIRVRGDNNHHLIEACFKGFARALRRAIARDGYELPTTKGQL